MKALRWSAVATALSVYVMIVFGALVRTTNSGMACPDWPTCYGQWVLTPAEYEALGITAYSYTQIMYEWGHRLYAAAIIGPLMLTTAFLAFRQRKADHWLPWIAVFLLSTLIVQKGLGGLTVFQSNSPWSVALHLGTALVILATVLLLWTRAGGQNLRLPVSRNVLALAAFITVAAFGTMLSAAMTAKSGASLACSTWPSCDGYVIPPLDDPLVRIHFLHRSLAALTGLAVLALSVVAWRQASPLRYLSVAALAVVTFQVSLGALVIVLYVPVWAGIVHQAVGVLLFILLSLTWWRASLSPRADSARPVVARGNAIAAA